MPRVALDRTGHQIPHDDSPRLSIGDHEIEHFPVRQRLDGALLDLAHHRLIRAKQELLTRLPPRIKRSRDLCAAKRSVVQKSAVFTRERDALSHALIDDVDAQLREPIDVRFAGSVVSTFDGVVKETVNAVAVVLIILRRVDASLGRDAVRAPGTVLNTKAENVVPQLTERGRGRRSSETSTDDDDGVLAPVRRVDQL